MALTNSKNLTGRDPVNPPIPKGEEHNYVEVIVSSTDEHIFTATLSGDKKDEKGETVRVLHKSEIKPNRPIKVHRDLAKMLKDQYKDNCTIQGETAHEDASKQADLKRQVEELQAKLKESEAKKSDHDPYPDKSDEELRVLIQERTGTMPHFNTKRANLISQLSE